MLSLSSCLDQRKREKGAGGGKERKKGAKGAVKGWQTGRSFSDVFDLCIGLDAGMFWCRIGSKGW